MVRVTTEPIMQVVLYCWYDNEHGYTCQVMRLMQTMLGVRRALWVQQRLPVHSMTCMLHEFPLVSLYESLPTVLPSSTCEQCNIKRTAHYNSSMSAIVVYIFKTQFDIVACPCKPLLQGKAGPLSMLTFVWKRHLPLNAQHHQ